MMNAHKVRVIEQQQSLQDGVKGILLKERNYCLHFDGKRTCDGTTVAERQVICLASPERELRLAVLSLLDGKAATIASAIAEVLDEYNAWPSIILRVLILGEKME